MTAPSRRQGTPVEYKGTTFAGYREAERARLFQENEWAWDYQPSGSNRPPDFGITFADGAFPDISIEVKGVLDLTEQEHRLYLIGRENPAYTNHLRYERPGPGTDLPLLRKIRNERTKNYREGEVVLVGADLVANFRGAFSNQYAMGLGAIPRLGREDLITTAWWVFCGRCESYGWVYAADRLMVRPCGHQFTGSVELSGGQYRTLIEMATDEDGEIVELDRP